MPKLTDQVKVYMVTRLACYATLDEVRTGVRELFGIEVSGPQVLYYDATAASTKLSEHFRQLFRETRERFNREVSEIPIASQSYRLKQLQDLFETDKKRGNTASAREHLEQAAKEIGNLFTNRRELTGKGGGPIEHKDTSLEDLPTEQLAALATKLAAEMGGIPA